MPRPALTQTPHLTALNGPESGLPGGEESVITMTDGYLFTASIRSSLLYLIATQV